MPKFLLFYQLEYLHHNYSIQYLKLVSFLTGTMPSDTVITCLCVLAICQKSSAICKKRSLIFLCVYVYFMLKSRK